MCSATATGSCATCTGTGGLKYFQPNQAARTRRMKMKKFFTDNLFSPTELGWQPQIRLLRAYGSRGRSPSKNCWMVVDRDVPIAMGSRGACALPGTANCCRRSAGSWSHRDGDITIHLGQKLGGRDRRNRYASRRRISASSALSSAGNFSPTLAKNSSWEWTCSLRLVRSSDMSSLKRASG
jgi:hypothetical protein